jgi:hypothetical protein
MMIKSHQMLHNTLKSTFFFRQYGGGLSGKGNIFNKPPALELFNMIKHLSTINRDANDAGF